MAKKEVKVKKEHTGKCCENVWMYVSIALGIAFIIALVFAIVGAAKASSGTTGIGANNAAQVVLDLMKKTQGIDANVIGAVEVNGLYKITLNAKDQNADIYVTLDGQNIMPGNAVFNVKDIENTAVTDKNAPVDQNTTPATTPTVYTLPKMIGQMPVEGNTASKITVVEFSDFQCPFCGMAFGAPWTAEYKTSQYASIIGGTQKIEELALAGKIAFVHFPVAFLDEQSPTKESHKASNAALCARDQNKYFEMHNVLFNAQTKTENDGKYETDKLKLLGAKVEGLDLNVFNSCLDSQKYFSTIDAITQDASDTSKANVGGFGTPAFYIVVDASIGKAKLESVLTPIRAEVVKAQPKDTTSYTFAPTADGLKYVIIADPEYAVMQVVINGLTA